jgi:hypothetical protein
MVAASWSMLRVVKLPRLSLMLDQMPSVGLSQCGDCWTTGCEHADNQ